MRNLKRITLYAILLISLPIIQARAVPGYHIDSEAAVQKAISQYAENSFKFRAVVYQSVLDKHSWQLTLAMHRYLMLKPKDIERKCSFVTAYWQTEHPGFNEKVPESDAKQLGSLYDEAVGDTKEVAQKMPNSATAQLVYGQYLQFFVPGLDTVPIRLKQYQKVVKLEPHIAEAHYLLGIAYVFSGDYSLKNSHQAIAELKKALSVNPHLTESYSYMATSYFMVNDWKMAKVSLQEYIHVNPKAAKRADVIAALKEANEKISTGATVSSE